MANLAKIYSDATRVLKPNEVAPENISPAEDATRIQLKINWLESEVTQKIFKEIDSQIQSLEEQARKLAVDYAQHNNHYRIIKLLIESDTLRKVLKEHGRPT